MSTLVEHYAFKAISSKPTLGDELVGLSEVAGKVVHSPRPDLEAGLESVLG